MIMTKKHTLDNDKMPAKMVDSYGRHITYLRLSVTDRCDFRCTYCMSTDMTFLPKNEVLSLEELFNVCKTFCEMGIRKIRISGGEPLVRKNIMWLFEQLGDLKNDGLLDEITITTNGSMLEKYAQGLKDAGVKRVNVSLDALAEDEFDKVTRSSGKFAQVMRGLDKASEVGLKVKLNTVVMNNFNGDKLHEFIQYSIDKNFDITFIEVMPMGDLGTESRLDQFLPLTEVKKRLAKHYNLIPSTDSTGGPSKYFRMQDVENTKVGFISPLSNSFCESCNRIRVTCTGVLYTCLGQDNNMNLRPLLRDGQETDLKEAIEQAIVDKPKEHNFVIDENNSKSVDRHMNVTGG